MSRFTMIVAFLCALAYLSAAPSDIEACRGRSSGRQIFAGWFRTPQFATYRTTSRVTYADDSAPQQEYQAASGCPGGVCRRNR